MPMASCVKICITRNYASVSCFSLVFLFMYLFYSGKCARLLVCAEENVFDLTKNEKKQNYTDCDLRLRFIDPRRGLVLVFSMCNSKVIHMH